VTESEIEFQAEKLLAYARKGGSPARWLRSKDFVPEDRAKITALAKRMIREALGVSAS
jgi:hypothetical protein